jgi:hypothetical protein
MYILGKKRKRSRKAKTLLNSDPSQQISQANPISDSKFNTHSNPVLLFYKSFQPFALKPCRHDNLCPSTSQHDSSEKSHSVAHMLQLVIQGVIWRRRLGVRACSMLGRTLYAFCWSRL